MIEAPERFDAGFGGLTHSLLAHASDDPSLSGDYEDEDDDPGCEKEQGEDGIAIHVSFGPALWEVSGFYVLKFAAVGFLWGQRALD